MASESSTIAVEIMTPERLLLQMQAEAVVLPGADGELGILPHHAPLLAQLEPGAIRLEHGGETELLAISGGFVEVEHNKIAIFAETAEMAHEIDVERARQAAERAKAELQSARSDADLAQSEAALRRALARIRATEGLRRTHKPAYR